MLRLDTRQRCCIVAKISVQGRNHAFGAQLFACKLHWSPFSVVCSKVNQWKSKSQDFPRFNCTVWVDHKITSTGPFNFATDLVEGRISENLSSKCKKFGKFVARKLLDVEFGNRTDRLYPFLLFLEIKFGATRHRKWSVDGSKSLQFKFWRLRLFGDRAWPNVAVCRSRGQRLGRQWIHLLIFIIY